MNTTIQKHLEGRRIEERASKDDEVLGFYEKAVRAFFDAHQGMSPDGRFLRAYDTGRLVALAILREAGFRMRGAEGQHFVTFDVARSLATDRDLRQVLKELDEIRKTRHQVQYDYEDDIGEADVAKAVALARQALDLGSGYLREARPSLAPHLETPPREP